MSLSNGWGASSPTFRFGLSGGVEGKAQIPQGSHAMSPTVDLVLTRVLGQRLNIHRHTAAYGTQFGTPLIARRWQEASFCDLSGHTHRPTTFNTTYDLGKEDVML